MRFSEVIKEPRNMNVETKKMHLIVRKTPSIWLLR